MYNISVEDFAKFINTTVEDLPQECIDLVNDTDLRYDIVIGEERDKLILNIFKTIDSKDLSIVGKHRLGVWEKGWGENLDNYIKSNYNFNELIPKYVKIGEPKRFNGNYIMPINTNFEYDLFNIFRIYFFKKYFSDVDYFYEFACGTGHNLITFAKMFPEKKIYGLDWSKKSIDLINKIAEVNKYNIEGRQFNFFSPDKSLKIQKNSAVMTMGGLEQTGSNYKNFVEYLISQSPKICINSEPMNEMYDKDILSDYLGLKYHKKRKYLKDYLKYLKFLESKNKIEIIKIVKIELGNLYQDGYSMIMWRPK